MNARYILKVKLVRSEGGLDMKYVRRQDTRESRVAPRILVLETAKMVLTSIIKTRQVARALSFGKMKLLEV